MSLSTNTKDVLLHNLYYAPSTQYTSIKTLYDNVKNKGITYTEVKDFIKNQEANQIFKKTKPIKYYFPITSKFKFEILQMDLADLSNLSASNQNYRYLFVAVDVYSRLAYVVPMKLKNAETVTEAIEEFVKKTSPLIINSDLGSEFISDKFRKLMTRQGTEINYVPKGEHHKLAIVDRFIRTLRQKINMYLTQYNTNKYIDVLNDLVYNYNHSYHTGIKKIPAEVKLHDPDIEKLNNEKYNKAISNETVFDIGQKVRYRLNRDIFKKGTLPKWSKTVHTIISSTPHSYILEDGKMMKYYELQPVSVVEKIENKKS